MSNKRIPGKYVRKKRPKKIDEKTVTVRGGAVSIN